MKKNEIKYDIIFQVDRRRVSYMIYRRVHYIKFYTLNWMHVRICLL